MNKTTKTNKKYFSPFSVLATLACIFLAVFVLHGYISLNELSLEANQKKSELATIESDNSVLGLQIERKNSIGNIEELATEQLGMVKLDSYRVQTVNLATDDSVEIAPKDSGNFFDGIVASFNILVEYLN